MSPPMQVGDRVLLAALDGGEPSTVEYRGQVGGYAVVVGADGYQFMVLVERISAQPPKQARAAALTATLGGGR